MALRSLAVWLLTKYAEWLPHQRARRTSRCPVPSYATIFAGQRRDRYRARSEEVCLNTEVNDAVEAALPKSLLVRAFIDALASVETVDELMAATGLPRARASEILNLRQCSTSLDPTTICQSSPHFPPSAEKLPPRRARSADRPPPSCIRTHRARWLRGGFNDGQPNPPAPRPR